jgi:hypothetical protein
MRHRGGTLPPVILAPYRYRQTLIIRMAGSRALDPIISALNEFTELRLLRIVDARILDGDLGGSFVAVTVEHLWWSRLSEALADVQAEMVSDLETPKAKRDGGPGPDQLRQIERLNEMRRIGTLTEAEFAQAKRDVLNNAD